MSEVNIQLQVGGGRENVNVSATLERVQVSTEGRLTDNYQQKQVADLPLPQRDVFSGAIGIILVSR